VPGLVYYALFFLLPMAIAVVISFGEPVGYGGVRLTVTLESYRAALDPVFLRVLARTMLFALAGTVLVLAVGFPAAYWIARYGGRRGPLLIALLIIPFWTSFLLRAFAFLIMFGEEWFVVRALRSAGFDDVRLLGSDAGVFIVLVYTYLPLAILPVYSTLERMDWRLVEAAEDLGAGSWTAFATVTAPTVARGVATGLLLVFVPMTGEYVVPQIIGSGTSVLYANLIGQQFLSAQNWPLGAALAMVLVVAMTLVAASVLGLRRER
jgi:spermidine/putrescine transport system permease protein